MKFGFSFSRRQCEWLGINWKDTFKKLDSTTLPIIRLGLYWNEIEESDNQYDFSLIKEELNLASELDKEVVLTIGMKAPRCPEFYIPEFIKTEIKDKKDIASNEYLQEKALDFIRESIKALNNEKVIKVFQVENEPLDPQWPDKTYINKNFLQKEIDLVNKLSDKPILINLWGNNLRGKKTLQSVFSLSKIDQIGFDFYPKQYDHKKQNYIGTDLDLDNLANIFNKARDSDFIPCICELQAEPWEGEFDYRIEHSKVKSISLKQIKENIRSYRKINPEYILLWGAEYWVYKNIEKDVVQLL